MHRKTLFIIALMSLLAIRFLVLDSGFIRWMTEEHFYTIASAAAMLRTQPEFLQFMGGWALPVFVFVILVYWMTEEEDADIFKQFLLLPVLYVPFSLAADLMLSGHFNKMNLFTHPLVILTFGYPYVIAWSLLIWIMIKLRLAKY